MNLCSCITRLRQNPVIQTYFVCYRVSILRDIFPTFKLENDMENRVNEANKTLIQYIFSHIALCKLHCIVQTVGVGFSLIVSSIAIDVIVMGLRVLYEKSVTVLCHLMILQIHQHLHSEIEEHIFKDSEQIFSKATTDSHQILRGFLDLKNQHFFRTAN